MAPTIQTIGIANGGGDCPGLNAVIRGAVRASIMGHGWRVVGINDGFDGLIWTERTLPLTVESIAGILPRGGTILGTTNRGNPFHYGIEENGKTVLHDYSTTCCDNMRKLGLDALIAIGGDGTLTIARDLGKMGIPVVGVPKTIDNDLSATEVTFGFDTALHVATDAIDRLHTTAESHGRVMVIEVMGRDAGWIALHSGMAGGADVIVQFLNAGLVDEFEIALSPVLLGAGLRLFDGIDPSRILLEPVETIRSPLVTHLRYAVRRR